MVKTENRARIDDRPCAASAGTVSGRGQQPASTDEQALRALLANYARSLDTSTSILRV